MREQRDKMRQNEIDKPWSHPRAMKKSIEKTNIDRNNLQRRKKQPHNIELICMINNKYKIISQKKKVRKNKSTETSLFPVMNNKKIFLAKRGHPPSIN
ncbi:hypothetical protein YC2023_065056 [Brassica napus]